MHVSQLDDDISNLNFLSCTLITECIGQAPREAHDEVCRTWNKLNIPLFVHFKREQLTHQWYECSVSQSVDQGVCLSQDNQIKMVRRTALTYNFHC